MLPQETYPSSSLTKLVIGPLFVIASLCCVWFTQTRFSFLDAASKAPQFSIHSHTDDAEQHPFVAITGTLALPHMLGEKSHLIPGEYLQCTRTTEVYAWEETHKPRHPASRNGEHITQPTLTYTPVWTAHPTPSQNFAEPSGHENPLPPRAPQTFTQHSFRVGDYTVMADGIELPEKSQLILSPENMRTKDSEVLTPHAVYTPKHPHTSPTSPLIGDTRRMYSVVPGEPRVVTVFGKLEGTTLVAAHLRDGFSSRPTLRLFWGTPDDALAALEHEEHNHSWLALLLGFLLMLCGFWMILRPTATSIRTSPRTTHFHMFLSLLLTSTFFVCAAATFAHIHNTFFAAAILICAFSLVLFWLRILERRMQSS